MKMTKEDKVEAFRMRLEGRTLQEIGDRFGVTRAYIHQILTDEMGRRAFKISCVYPGLEKWMREHEMPPTRLREEMGMFARTERLCSRLDGKTQFKINEIKLILEITGMTFEEAFC